ncbi:hypothetical protein BX616_008737 [Lobosporangium transversale]|uniref:Uncharacterized protein n=1 Tax=Lobosporangium transversale TaxID=64571 RepID=A0A1Y2GVC4_9FUNG|nr:hypothetical protein BCR41DRAFT_350291 [Lobosporangium transversale]KAF9895831.1 hypothetical protein BX616_008737 [Lobosporangium transversale]ORZ21958.1 hypothetical protein BCR41DRAFT_350291 [Lobosporangium transversale]|eukprot:XP_021883209.1 hypothetical protein BCR41DRAFT_350291 [Lobosporangium transversale]
MPRSTFVNHDFVLTVLAIYGATVAFTRWFPEADLVAVEAHPSTYVKTFEAASQSQLTLYAAHLAIDIIRVLSLAVLESAAFSFAFIDDVFEPFSYAFILFSMVIVTKDILMLGCLHAFPASNDLAAAKVAELMPLSATVEYGLLLCGALSLAKGLYQWTYAIGRDKRQVIDKEEIKKTQ